MILLGLTFGLAFALSLYGVGLARQAATKYGIVDRPDGRLKNHREPVPYLGGLAIYVAFLVSLAFTFEFRHDVLGIVLAGTLAMLLGLIDDFGVLSPRTKLLGQLLAVFVLIKSGIRIEIAAFPEWLDVALTVFWMIGLINAFNLLDIMDGLSAGVALVSSLFLLAVALINGDSTIAFMVTALAGSLLGFLRHNFHPAKIYMGDAGALFVGLMVGALAMIGQYPGSHPVALMTPVLILGVPIFDTLFVMYIRFLRGLPILMGSPDHMPIRLRHWGMTVPQVVLVNYAACGVMGAVGLAVMSVGERAAVMLIGLVGALFVAFTVVLQRVDVRRSSATGLRGAVASSGSETGP
jgi:UDP-GlcNAc:undecaprenyl-phosphate GlcNAc-1-phosphate transferase